MSANPRITDWRGRRVWIVGASAGIGEALALALAQAGARLALSARRIEGLASVRTQIVAGRPERAGDVLLLPVDVTEIASLRSAHDAIVEAWGGIDLVVWMAGSYTPMRAEQFDPGAALRMLDTNLGGLLNGLAVLAPQLGAARIGGIAIVASVAGYVGLPKALVYGPTKAAMINLAESLYLDLHPKGVGVTLICPGFVATRLTAVNDFAMPALRTPAQAAAAILRGLARGHFEIHFPRRFTLWLKLVRLLPYRLQFALLRRLA
jgi:NADP-dependent 3-hydroxy acid dehydrogenase YdfG